MITDLATGNDGLERCSWALAATELTAYHDREWGMPVLDDDALFERICLESFQCGLSWLTVLRRRQALRAAFAGFRIERVAGFGEPEIERLLADSAIIRNRGKILAAIENARRAQEVIEEIGSLAGLIWRYAETATPSRAPRSYADIPTITPQSRALADELRRRGFRFLGPTTVCALMQACGLLNAHLAGCHRREGVERARTDALARLGLG